MFTFRFFFNRRQQCVTEKWQVKRNRDEGYHQDNKLHDEVGLSTSAV